MTANIGLRLVAPNKVHIVIAPTESATFRIDVTDVAGRPVSRADFEEAVAWVLVGISELRGQLFEMIGRKKPRK